MCKAAFRILKQLENPCILCSCSTLQVFDSNVNKDKLLRLKLGSGKVIKVQLVSFISKHSVTVTHSSFAQSPFQHHC